LSRTIREGDHPKMKFSIIIPLYNKSPYIADAIESVLAQTCSAWELIVIDDGSTDDGPQKVRRFDDARIRLLSQPNAGVSAARNAGIAHATGEWVAFLDADDRYHPKYLQALIGLAVAHPDCDAIATGFAYEPADARSSTAWSVPASTRHERITNLARRWMRKAPFCMDSFAVRASRLREMQPCFPFGEATAEDMDLYFRVAEQTDIALDDRPLVAYRTHVPDSLSRAAPELPAEFPRYLARMDERVKRGLPMSSEKRRGTAWFVDQQRISLARKALAASERARAARLLWDARRGVTSHRWWFTVFMLALMTPEQVVRRELRGESERLRASGIPGFDRRNSSQMR
jgi:glycosyltransferase involved in cell wall biosynthesis